MGKEQSRSSTINKPQHPNQGPSTNRTRTRLQQSISQFPHHCSSSLSTSSLHLSSASASVISSVERRVGRATSGSLNASEAVQVLMKVKTLVVLGVYRTVVVLWTISTGVSAMTVVLVTGSTRMRVWREGVEVEEGETVTVCFLVTTLVAHSVCGGAMSTSWSVVF